MTTPTMATIGDNVVDCYVEQGWMFPGGNAVNVAVHCERLGVPATYVGAIGTDQAGQLVKRSLLEENVDISGSLIVDGPNAYATVKLVDGNRTFGDGDIGVSRFDPTAAQLEILGAVDHVHTGDCSMMENHLTAIRRSARRLSFDFSIKPWSYIERIAPSIDIAFCSLGDDDDDRGTARARQVAALGPRVVIVTRGGAGATLLVDDEVHFANADLTDAAEIVDTLGAGDALAARFLSGTLLGEAPQAALDAAVIYATQSCAEYGAFGHRAPLDANTLTLHPQRSAKPMEAT